MKLFHLHLSSFRRHLKKFKPEEDATPVRMMEIKQSTENIGLSSRPPQTNAEGKVQTVQVEEKTEEMILALAEAVKNINIVTVNKRKSSMKKIEAIIRPFKLDEVKEALVEEGVHGLDNF